MTQAAAYLIGQLEELGYIVDVEDVTPAYNTIRADVFPAEGPSQRGGRSLSPLPSTQRGAARSQERGGIRRGQQLPSKPRREMGTSSAAGGRTASR